MANTARMAILRAKIEGSVTDLMLKTTAEHVFVDSNTTLATKLATLAEKASLEQLQQTVDNLGALGGKDKISYADLEEALAALIDGKAEASALTEEINRAKAAEEANAVAAAAAQAAAEAAQADADALEGRMDTVEGKVTTLIGSDANKSVRTIANEEATAAANAEKSRAEGIEAGLRTDINAVVADYLKTADKTELSNAIAAEKSRAEGIEAGLRTDIDAVKTDYLKAADKTELSNAIAAEKERAEAAEAGLQTQINTIMNNPDAEGAINSINEFTQYVADHGEIAEGFRTSIAANRQSIDELSNNLAETVDGFKQTIGDEFFEHVVVNDVEIPAGVDEYDIEFERGLELDKEYVVLFDGIAYDCVATYLNRDDIGLYIGDNSEYIACIKHTDGNTSINNKIVIGTADKDVPHRVEVIIERKFHGSVSEAIISAAEDAINESYNGINNLADAVADTYMSKEDAAAELEALANQITAKAVQADWNQNDSTAGDFVKNRPFYEEFTYTLISEDDNLSVEGMMNNTIGGQPSYNYRISLGTPNVECGKTYVVEIDGVRYEQVPVPMDSGNVCMFIGNPLHYNSAEVPANEANNVPFSIVTYYSFSHLYVPNPCTKVAVYSVESETVTINDKFIPDTIARASALNEEVNRATAAEEALGQRIDQMGQTVEQFETTTNGVIEGINGKITALEETAAGLGDLATKDVVSESDLDADLAAKVNASSAANHTHANKELLDSYTQTEANLADAVAKKHEHDNKNELDSITAAMLSSWMGKAKVYGANEVVDLADNEIYIQLV